MAWIALIVALIVLLAVDLFLIRGRGEMTVRTAAVWSVAWVAISLAFAAVLLLVGDRSQAEGFLAGYLVEKSLSLDNVFVFLIVFQAFAVPVAERARLLTYGIVGALVLRAIFIFAGAAALHTASWLAFPFAALLAWTGWRLWRNRHDHGGEEQLVERIRKRLPANTAGAALVVIAVVDIIFAVDSVPAILAITTDTFVVFAANAFALLGLRPLFFFVADLVERLYYLKAALAVLLMFIAAKMALGELVGKVSPVYSLVGVFLILGTGVAASLVRRRRFGDGALDFKRA
jgi:tellurite resistance protein TerC